MKRKIFVILLIVLLAMVAFQTVQLVQLSGAVSAEDTGYESSASNGANVPSNLQNLPQMVGGC